MPPSAAAMTATAITVNEAQTQFSKIATEVCKTGQPVTIFKDSKPWVKIVPSKTIVPSAINEKADNSKTSAKASSSKISDDVSKSTANVSSNADASDTAEGNSAYIEALAAALRESKQQFASGHFYTGADTLFEKLKESNPAVWAACIS